VKGSVSPGKLADLVVLDRDPFQVAPSELKSVKPTMTIVGGGVVYERRASVP
jgi:predicted amidohydrolase YtcJ